MLHVGRQAAFLCFVQQKTAYEMRISDWSSDVCSSDLIEPTGTSLSPVPASPVMSVGIRAPRPLPSPLRRATAHLLGQFPVGNGAPGARIERDDRLPEGRCLREPDRAREIGRAHV